MASTGREILGEHYDDEHLTYEEIRGLGLGWLPKKARRSRPTSCRVRSAIHLAVQRDGDRAVLEVADRGWPTTWPPAPSSASSGPTPLAPATGGTGLAIVKATVDAHGGDVTLRTTAGQGTAVRVELPILEGGDQFAGPVPSKQSDRA